MTTTKRTTELAAGDVVVANGAVVMTVRRVAEAVSPKHCVVWFFGPRGGKRSEGYLKSDEWEVRA